MGPPPSLLTPARTRSQRRQNPAANGQPDPRPLTGYTVALSTVGGNSRLTVTLDQPCVIRSPKWGFINCSTGAKTFANTVTVVNNTTFYFDFVGVISTAIAFVDVPYQDMQVQNFQGGFVKPGGQWFRKPT